VSLLVGEADEQSHEVEQIKALFEETHDNYIDMRKSRDWYRFIAPDSDSD
jgi:hypothetical protein